MSRTDDSSGTRGGGVPTSAAGIPAAVSDAWSYGIDAWSYGIDAWSYGIDAWQRTVLFWDVLRRCSNQHLEYMAQKVPHVLRFKGEPVVDGRALPRPVNYGLVRIVPPAGVTVDPMKRPFVVVDPRAG